MFWGFFRRGLFIGGVMTVTGFSLNWVAVGALGQRGLFASMLANFILGGLVNAYVNQRAHNFQ